MHDTGVDVAIVGGGYTGLWTAYYLLRADPTLSVLVLEAAGVGFGASGRNGGWVSALYPVPASVLARTHGPDAARATYAAVRGSLDEVERVIGTGSGEAIRCGFVRGGTVVVARNPAQVSAGRTAVQENRTWGGAATWLDAPTAASRLAARDVQGASYDPDCARVHPYDLARGLASAVERLGGRIVEATPVARIQPHRLLTAHGVLVRAAHIIRATEGFTARLPGLRRRLAPVYSMVVATEPLSDAQWDAVGLREYETFSEHRHMIVYGQRTTDGRLVFGGRGAPYHFGSAVAGRFDVDQRVFTSLRKTLRDMLPGLGGARFTHAWGGPLGVPRDWQPAACYHPTTGLGFAGGYVGDGVALSNLAGRTLADLVRGEPSELTRLPWVQHRWPSWEPEPLRWAGVNAGLRLANLADRKEHLTGEPARLGRLLDRLTAHS